MELMLVQVLLYKRELISEGSSQSHQPGGPGRGPKPSCLPLSTEYKKLSQGKQPALSGGGRGEAPRGVPPVTEAPALPFGDQECELQINTIYFRINFVFIFFIKNLWPYIAGPVGTGRLLRCYRTGDIGPLLFLCFCLCLLPLLFLCFCLCKSKGKRQRQKQRKGKSKGKAKAKGKGKSF